MFATVISPRSTACGPQLSSGLPHGGPISGISVLPSAACVKCKLAGTTSTDQGKGSNLSPDINKVIVKLKLVLQSPC